MTLRTYLAVRRAPLPEQARAYIQGVFDRNWGERLREELGPDDWERATSSARPTRPGPS